MTKQEIVHYWLYHIASKSSWSGSSVLEKRSQLQHFHYWIKLRCPSTFQANLIRLGRPIISLSRTHSKSLVPLGWGTEDRAGIEKTCPFETLVATGHHHVGGRKFGFARFPHRCSWLDAAGGIHILQWSHINPISWRYTIIPSGND